MTWLLSTSPTLMISKLSIENKNYKVFLVIFRSVRMSNEAIARVEEILPYHNISDKWYHKLLQSQENISEIFSA